jgi:hypothetical protein
MFLIIRFLLIWQLTEMLATCCSKVCWKTKCWEDVVIISDEPMLFHLWAGIVHWSDWLLAGDMGFDSWEKEGFFFSLPYSDQLTGNPYSLLPNELLSAVALGSKCSGSETDGSLQFSIEVCNAWSVSLIHAYVFITQYSGTEIIYCVTL